MPRKSTDKRAMAAETWRRLFEFFIHTKGQRDCVLGELGLTPNDARALHALHVRDGHTMRTLADCWGCDASNATSIVDRLEALGLAERQSVASDRRVKRVVLTARGRRTITALRARMFEPPPELLALDLAELRALRDAVARLPAEGVDA